MSRDLSRDRRRTARQRIAGATAAAAAGALLAVGCSAPGELHDGGRTRRIAAHPSPQPLWPGIRAVGAPSPRVSSGRSAPAPLPGLTVPDGDIQAVSATRVLGRDPALERDELAALHDCPRCDLRPPQYRDLTGDGRPELITALITPDDRAVLHVYTLRSTRIVPVLDLSLTSGFSAQTLGRDLVVVEPTTASLLTSSTYRWDGTRLSFADRRITATGPGPAGDALDCAPTPTAAPAEPPSIVPTAEPSAGSLPIPALSPRPAGRGERATTPTQAAEPTAVATARAVTR